MGGGGEPEMALEATTQEAAQPELALPAPQEPAIEEPAAPASTQMPPAAGDSTRIEPTIEPSEKIGVQEAPSGEPFAQHIPEDAQTRSVAPLISAPVQIILAGIAILSALVAFTLRYTAIRKWRARAK
jgi:hypothetical protein